MCTYIFHSPSRKPNCHFTRAIQLQGNGNGVIKEHPSGTVLLAFTSLASVHIGLVGRIDSNSLIGPNDLVDHIDLIGLIEPICFVDLNSLFIQISIDYNQLIVAATDTKISLHFSKSFAIFREGDRKNANNQKVIEDDEVFVSTKIAVPSFAICSHDNSGHLTRRIIVS